jgi:hypothetical protein
VRGQATSWHETSRGVDDEALLCFVLFPLFVWGFGLTSSSASIDG